MPTKVIMPQLGESVVEGTVVKWLCQEGDRVEEFDSLLEVESAKVNTELPSPAGGVVLKLLVEEGTTVKAGTIIAWIGEAGEEIPEEGGTPAEDNVKQKAQAAPAEKATANAEPPQVGRNRELGFISPIVARLSHEHDVDLNQIKGSGQGGRITKKDVLNYIDQQSEKSSAKEPAAWETPGEGDLFRPTELQFPDRFKQPSADGAAEKADRARASVSSSPASGDQLIPHTTMRKSIAAHMLRSKQVSPHVTTVMEGRFKQGRSSSQPA